MAVAVFCVTVSNAIPTEACPPGDPGVHAPDPGVHVRDPAVHAGDPSVHVGNPGVHIPAIRVFTSRRSRRSRPRSDRSRPGDLSVHASAKSALDDIANAGSLAEIVGELDDGASDARSRLQQLADACDLLARLCNGAMRRLGYSRSDESPAAGLVLRVIDLAALGVLRGQDSNYAEAMEDALPTLRAELPLHIAETIGIRCPIPMVVAAP